MNLILDLVQKENNRIYRMLAHYRAVLDSLPKGSITEKHVKEHVYYYLKYRDGDKVITEYIKKKDLSRIEEQLDRRRHTERMIDSLENEAKLASRILEGNV